MESVFSVLGMAPALRSRMAAWWTAPLLIRNPAIKRASATGGLKSAPGMDGPAGPKRREAGPLVRTCVRSTGLFSSLGGSSAVYRRIERLRLLCPNPVRSLPLRVAPSTFASRTLRIMIVAAIHDYAKALEHSFLAQTHEITERHHRHADPDGTVFLAEREL